MQLRSRRLLPAIMYSLTSTSLVDEDYIARRQVSSYISLMQFSAPLWYTLDSCRIRGRSRLMTLFPVQLRSGSSRITQHVHFTEIMFTGLGFYGMPTFLLFFDPSMQTNFHIGIPSTLLNAKTATALLH